MPWTTLNKSCPRNVHATSVIWGSCLANDWRQRYIKIKQWVLGNVISTQLALKVINPLLTPPTVISFIHGGSWRDHDQTYTTFSEKIMSTLKTAPRYESTIAGSIKAFASIEYRLSTYTNESECHSSSASRELATTRHPDHIHDVQSALSLLEHNFGFGDRYLLVGHSCGATLAFQAVMNIHIASSPARYMLPVAILGNAGIYDLMLFRELNSEKAMYHEILNSAFGCDDSNLHWASPAAVKGTDGVEGGWTAGRLAVLSHSPHDELLQFEQTLAMCTTLEGWKSRNKEHRQVRLLSVRGTHDRSWQDGEELARAIAFTLEAL